MIFSRKKKTDFPSRRLQHNDVRQAELDANAQFRRNRTMSGVKPRVEVGSSSRSKVHHLTMRRQKVGGILLLVLIGIAVLALLITQLTARVIVSSSSAAVSNKIDGKDYEKVINDYLGIHPAARLRFLLNETELSDYASNMTPEVSRIEQTSVANVVETHFTVTFRKPIAGWQINGKQYYVDDQGIVFQKNYYEAPAVQIVDESGISPEQGSIVASARLLSFVGRVVALSRAGGHEVTQAILPSGTTRELDITIKDSITRMKLSIDRGAGEQVEDYSRALAYLTSKQQTAGYIDVRVAGRAAYQ
jgi:hypothetical protein